MSLRFLVNNIKFLLRYCRMIFAPQKFDVLSFKNIKFLRGTYQTYSSSCIIFVINTYGFKIYFDILLQFELVCERGSLGFVSTSVIFAGFFIGSIVVSSFSDKFGRKRPLFLCGFICCIFNLVSAFSPAFWVFALFRAILGFTIGKLHKFDMSGQAIL